MKLLDSKREITDNRLIEYIEKERGISREVYSPLLNQFEVLVKNHNKPARKAIYCGMVNYKGNGAFISNWFKKTGSRYLFLKCFLDEKHPIILNYFTRKCILFSSIWDLMSYLNLNIEVQDKIKQKVCLIVVIGGTKKDFKDLQLEKFAKVGSCFRRNETGDRYTRNFLKVFPKGIDLRDKELIGNAKSLNDVVKGVI